MPRTITRTLLMLPLILLVSCSAEPRPFSLSPNIRRAPRPLAGDYAAFQGVWNVTYCERWQRPYHKLTRRYVTFREDLVSFDTDNGSEAFLLDESHNPKHITFNDGRLKPILAVYILNGNQLTICSADPGDPRPTEFATSPNSGTILTKLEKDFTPSHP